MNYGSKVMKKAKKGMYNMGGAVINTGPSNVNGNYDPVAADMQRQNMQMGKDAGYKGYNRGGLQCGASNPPSKKRT